MRNYLDELQKNADKFLEVEGAVKNELAKIKSREGVYDGEYLAKQRQEQLDFLEGARKDALQSLGGVQADFNSMLDVWATPKGENLTSDAVLLREPAFNLTAQELTNLAEKYQYNASMSRLIHGHKNTPETVKAMFYGADARKEQFAKVADIYQKLVFNKQFNDNSQYLALVNDAKFQSGTWLGHPALQGLGNLE